MIDQVATEYSKEALSYVGSPRPYYNINVPSQRNIAREFLKTHPDLTQKEFETLLTSLYNGKTFTERTMPGFLLQYDNDHRHALDPQILNSWIGQLTGWCEIDTTCQAAFSAEDMLHNWNAWKKLLTQFSKSNDISKRRASIVLLNKVVQNSPDHRCADVAFVNVDRLKHENDILITKAVSWILRSLIAHHRTRVKKYLTDNKDALPKIALRETQNKLKTGTKKPK